MERAEEVGMDDKVEYVPVPIGPERVPGLLTNIDMH